MERGEREEEEPKELRRESKSLSGKRVPSGESGKSNHRCTGKNGPVEVNPRSIGFGLSKCLRNSTKEGTIHI